MPVYEYKCPKCKKIIERTSTIDKRDSVILCNLCNVQLKRCVSAPPVHFIGGNWAFDGYDEESAPATGGVGDDGYEESVARKKERATKEYNL